MRFGSNPYKLESVQPYEPKDVTVAVLVHIPHLAGYFMHKLELLRLCISSIRKHTDLPYDLMVFDNGSCAEVIKYLLHLRDQEAIRYLILAGRNMGVVGAYNLMFSVAPGRYVAYSDDDIFFYPGWLAEQLRVLETFPDVGMVSGLPIWQGFGKYTDSTLRIAGRDPSIRVEQTKGWPREWVEEYCESIGWDMDGFIRMCRNIEVVRLWRDGVSSLATCTHCQFLARKSVLAGLLPFGTGGKAMAAHHLDEQIDSAGFMRLSTVRPYVQHMGNHPSTRIALLSEKYGLNTVFADIRKVGTSPSSAGIRLLRRRKVRRVLQAVYNKVFEWMTIADGKWGEHWK